MKIKIICGSYGYRTKYGVKPVLLGGTCDVDSMEAGRLAGLGVAEILDAPTTPAVASAGVADVAQECGDTPAEQNAAQGPAGGNLDAVELESMTVAQLKKLAGEMGIDTKDLKRKDSLIAAICTEEVYPGDEADGPDLGAEAPVM